MTPGGYDAFDDPYSYRGSHCLKNRLGLRDPDVLQAFELEMSSPRATEPLPTGHFGPAVLGTAIVLAANTVLRDLSRYLNTTPVSSAEIAVDYTIRVVCRAEDEVHVRTLLTNSTHAIPLSFRSLKSEDLVGTPGALEVLAELRLHPKDQAKLEQLTSRISLEKGVSAVSWVAKPLELVTD